MLKLRKYWIVISIFSISIITGLIGLDWGLPSSKSISFYPIDKFDDNISNIEIYQIGPLESLHPDEGNILNALSNMDPSKFDFNPKFFNYPSFHIYLVGTILKISQILNIIELKNDRNFYLKNPGEFAKIFYIGRLISIFMAALTAVLLYNISHNLFNEKVALVSTLALMFTPLWVRNIHFMQVNVPITFWITLTIYFLSIYIKINSKKHLILSSLTAGLATSTKYTGGIFIFIPIIFFFINREKSKSLLSKILIIPLIVFFLTNPYIFLSLGDFFNDLLFESNKLSNPSFLYLLNNIAISNGSFSLVLIMIGIIYSVTKISKRPFQILLLWFMATSLIPFISAHDNWGLIRYLIPTLPVLAIFMAISIHKIFIFLNKFISAYSFYFITTFCLIPSILYSYDIITILTNKDIRLKSSNWIEENILANNIGIIRTIYFDFPIINSDKFKIIPIWNLDINKWPNTLVFSSSNESEHYIKAIPKSYKLIKQFNQRPQNIWTYPFNNFFEDWQYTFLDIFIYQKE